MVINGLRYGNYDHSPWAVDIYNADGRFWVILRDSDIDTLAMVIAGVASVVGGLCYRLCHARMGFGELLGRAWGFIASRGAIPIPNSKLLGDTFNYRVRCGTTRM